jgi:AcrR family transcriptional regulator
MNETPQSAARNKRLEEVAAAAAATIIEQGLGVTSLRDISRKGGFTTGVLSHYFADKEEVIVGAFSAASDKWIAKVRKSFSAIEEPSDLLVALVELAVPNHADSRAEWLLWADMWAYAARHPDFARYVQETDMLWERELDTLLERARRGGLLPAELDTRGEARVLARLIDGLGLRACLTGEWTAARESLILHLDTLGVPDDVLGRLRTGGGST